MRPASNARRVIPQKETRRQKTKQQLDKRPHISTISNNCIIETDDSDITLTRKNIEHWTKREIRELITQNDQIFQFKPEVKRKLLGYAGFILSRLKNSNFICPITKSKFLGGLEYGGQGIGIDFIHLSNKISRNNIRLIAGPLAIARRSGINLLRCNDVQREDYEDHILYAISKHLQWAIKNKVKVKYTSIIADFSNTSDFLKFRTVRIENLLVDGKWDSHNYHSIIKLAEEVKNRSDNYNLGTFMSLKYTGDTIIIKYCIGWVENRNYNTINWQEDIIQLYDPNSDIISKVLNLVNISYNNFIRAHFAKSSLRGILEL